MLRTYQNAASAKATLRKHQIGSADYSKYLVDGGTGIWFNEEGKPILPNSPQERVKSYENTMAGMFHQMSHPMNNSIPKIARRAVVVKDIGQGIAIERNRETRNGVTKPSSGGKCRAVWDALDEVHKTVPFPTAKHAKEIAAKFDWNVNNCVLELYAWRNFTGLKK